MIEGQFSKSVGASDCLVYCSDGQGSLVIELSILITTNELRANSSFQRKILNLSQCCDIHGAKFDSEHLCLDAYKILNPSAKVYHSE